MTDSASTAAATRADRLAENVRGNFRVIETYVEDGGREQERRWDEADACLDALLALAKQGEAYERALAHAQSTYGFANTTNFGHVPVEAFAAAMTELEKAEKLAAERFAGMDRYIFQRDRAEELTEAAEADRDRLAAALDAIAFNAESWHAGEDGKARALAVIAKWARDPGSIPAGVGEALSPGATQEQAQ